MMFPLDFGKNRNAEFPVGKVDMHAAHDVTKDTSVFKKAKSLCKHCFVKKLVLQLRQRKACPGFSSTDLSAVCVCY